MRAMKLKDRVQYWWGPYPTGHFCAAQGAVRGRGGRAHDTHGISLHYSAITRSPDWRRLNAVYLSYLRMTYGALCFRDFYNIKAAESGIGNRWGLKGERERVAYGNWTTDTYPEYRSIQIICNKSLHYIGLVQILALVIPWLSYTLTLIYDGIFLCYLLSNKYNNYYLFFDITLFNTYSIFSLELLEWGP